MTTKVQELYRKYWEEEVPNVIDLHTQLPLSCVVRFESAEAYGKYIQELYRKYWEADGSFQDR